MYFQFFRDRGRKIVMDQKLIVWATNLVNEKKAAPNLMT